MKPTRHAIIRGHLVEEFRSLNCPICYVDAHRVASSFDHAVADLQAAGRVPPGNVTQNVSSFTTAGGYQSP
jgi:hypothetical protein